MRRMTASRRTKRWITTLVEKIDGNVDYLNPDAYGCVLCSPMEKAIPTPSTPVRR